MIDITKMNLSKGNKLNNRVTDVIFEDEPIEIITDEQVKPENDEDDIFDETLEREMKKDNSDADNKSYYINRHGEREYICSGKQKSEIIDCIIIDDDEVEKNEIKSEDDDKNLSDKNVSGTNKTVESKPLEIDIKDEDEECQKDIKLEPLIDNNIKQSMDIKYECSKCSFKGNRVDVFRKHLLTHEDSNSNPKKRTASTQVDIITTINDELTQKEHCELENGNTLPNIDILSGDTDPGGSALTLNKENRKIQSDKVMVDGSNSVHVPREKLNHQSSTAKNDQLINGELKGRSNLKKKWKRKLINHKHKINSKMKVNSLNKVSKPNRQFRKLKKHRKGGKQLNTSLSAHVEAKETVKNQVKINSDSYQETENREVGPKPIFVLQNAVNNLETDTLSSANSNDKIIERGNGNFNSVGKNTESFLFSEENERLTDTINKIKYIIYNQDCYKTIANIQHANDNTNNDNKVMGDLNNGPDKNKESISYSKEFEILAATLTQIKNIICNKDSSLAADKTRLSTTELPKETAVNAKETDQSDIPNKRAKYTNTSLEYSCTKCTFKAKRKAILKRHLLKHSKSGTVDRKIEIEGKYTDKSVGESNIGVAAEEKPKENPISRNKRTDCHKGKRRRILQLNRKKSVRNEEIMEELTTIIYSCTICSFTAKRQSIVKRHFFLKHDEYSSSITPKMDLIRVVKLPKKLKKEEGVLRQDATNLPTQGRPKTLPNSTSCDNTSAVNSEKETKTRKSKSDIVCKDNPTSDLNIGKEIESNVNVIEHEKKNTSVQGRPIKILQDIISDNINAKLEKETKTVKHKSDVTICKTNGTSILNSRREIEADANVVEHEKKNGSIERRPIETSRKIISCDNISVINSENQTKTMNLKSDVAVCQLNGTSALSIRKELETDINVVHHEKKNRSIERPIESLQNIISYDNTSVANSKKDIRTKKQNSGIAVCKDDGISALDSRQKLETNSCVSQHEQKNCSIKQKPMETLQNTISCDNTSVVNSKKEIKTRKQKSDITSVCKENGPSALNSTKELETDTNVVEHEKKNCSIQARPIETLQNIICCDYTLVVNPKDTKTRKLKSDITICKDDGISALNSRKELETDSNVQERTSQISCNSTSVINSKKGTRIRKPKRDITVCKDDNNISALNTRKKLETDSNGSIQGRPIATLQNIISCGNTLVIDTKREAGTRKQNSEIVSKDNGTSALNSRNKLEIDTDEDKIRYSCDNASRNSKKETKTRKPKINICKDNGTSAPNAGKGKGTDTSVVEHKKINRLILFDKNCSSEDLSNIEMEYFCTKCTFKAKRRSIVKRHYLLKHGIEDANDDSLISFVKKTKSVNSIIVAEYKNAKNKRVPDKTCKTSRLEEKEVKAVEGNIPETKNILNTRTDEVEAAYICDNEKEKPEYKNSQNKDSPYCKHCKALGLEEKVVNTVEGTGTKKTKNIVGTQAVTHEIEAVYIVCNNEDGMKTENSSPELTNQVNVSAKERVCIQNVHLNEENDKVIEKVPENVLQCECRPEQLILKSETKEEKESDHSSNLSIVDGREFERFFKENCVYDEYLINSKESNEHTGDNMIFENVGNSVAVNKEEEPREKLNEYVELKPVITLETVDSKSIVKKEINYNVSPTKRVPKSESENVKLYSCDECSYKTSNKKYLTRHKIIHSNSVIKCNMCSYITNQQRFLTLHNVIHLKPDEIELFKCAHCPYAAKRRRNLKEHMVLHMKDALIYQCDRCHYRSKRKSNLRIHQVAHKEPDEVELFKCAACSFQTKKKAILKSHMIVHQRLEDIYWYECDKCIFKSKFKSGLVKHSLIHKPPEEVNIYVCAVCQYRTKYKCHLEAHLQLHKDPSEVYMHQCQHCSYKTLRKGNLHTHMLQHKKIEEIDMKKCGNCSFATRLKGNLAKHINRKHRSH